MYNTILLPLDGSELSECALDHVAAVADGCEGREVVLLRVLEHVVPHNAIALGQSEHIAEFEEQEKAEAKQYLLNAKGCLEKDGLLVKTVLIEEGRPAGGILEYASKNPVDLIVMSTHGRSGISRAIFGSVTDEVVRHSTVPVLTVLPAECRFAS